MKPTPDQILSFAALKNGNLTVAEAARQLGVSEKEAEERLYALVLAGKLRRWPGIAGNPATHHLPGAAPAPRRHSVDRSSRLVSALLRGVRQ